MNCENESEKRRKKEIKLNLRIRNHDLRMKNRENKSDTST